MILLSQAQKTKIINLFENGKFTELEFEIESISNFKDRSPFLANMLGVIKLKKPSANQSDLEEARKLFKDSYEKDPNYIDAMCNLGHVSVRLRNYEYIFKELKRYVKNKDYNKKIYETLGRIFFFNGDVDEALQLYKKMIDNNDTSADASANFLTSLNYSSKFSQEEYFHYCKKINERFKPENLIDLLDTQIDKNLDNLNIGFISPDLIEHSVTDFLLGTIKELKKKKFHIQAFNLRAENRLDKTSDSLKEIFDEWHNLEKLNDMDAANLIRNSKTNILINLVGYFARNRFSIMKYKAAPVQMLWMGYVNTMGIDEIDYIVTDPNLIKKEEKKFYSEQEIRLPKIWNCHSGINYDIKVENLPSIKNKYFTFGCFNNTPKITDEVIKTWSQILTKKDNSKIMIKAPSEDAEIGQENILKKFKVFNIDRSRIIISSRKEKRIDHLKMYNQIDICLDTFPYPGVTTSIESVWMGVPVLTLEGTNFVSRCGESINKNLNMYDFIAKDLDDYVQKAISISEDIKGLSEIRKTLRDKALNSPIFDMSSFGEDFSNMLNDVWSRYKSK